MVLVFLVDCSLQYVDISDILYNNELEVNAMSERVKLQLEKYTEIISSLEWVLQIFLFGSHAYGESHEDSDLDLLVIVDDSLDPINATFKINQQLIGKRAIPLDVVVNRKRDFEYALNGNTIQKLISDNGELLYEAN